MAVAGNADPMLGYLTTSFREHPANRRALGKFATLSMQQRLTALGALADRPSRSRGPDTVTRLYAHFVKRGGDRRTADALEDEGRRRLQDLRERGFDLALDSRSVARAAGGDLHSTRARALRNARRRSPRRRDVRRSVRVRTTASSRDEYLARPPAGEAAATGRCAYGRDGSAPARRRRCSSSFPTA